VSPPPFDSLVSDAARRDRRARVVTATLTCAVIAVLALGLALVRDGDDPAFQPVDEPSSSATTTRAIELPAGVLPLPETIGEEQSQPLDEGRYQVVLGDTLALEVDLPQDTTTSEGGLYLLEPDGVLKVELAGEKYGVPIHPCDNQFPLPAGPTVDDLVRAIREAPIYEVGQAEPVEIGGATGSYFEIRIPAEFDSTVCKGSEVGMPGNQNTTNNMAPGHVGRWWVLDVDGQRVVVQHFCYPQCGPGVADRAARTVRGITFTSS
jgi:hypothetical protein